MAVTAGLLLVPSGRVLSRDSQEDDASSGFRLERRVRQTMTDLVGRRSEVLRLERVTIDGGNVAIEDLTFGRAWIVRPDKELVWVIDTVAGTYAEATFEAIERRRREVIEELVEARRRVPGTSDEREIGDILIGLGVLPPEAEVRVHDTGKVEQIGGRPCPQKEVRIGKDIAYFSVFVDPSLSGALAYYDVLARAGGLPPKVAEKVKVLGGFPVKGTVRYSLFLDRVVSDEEVLDAARGRVDPEVFERPSNLTRTRLEHFDRPERRMPEKPRQFERSFREDDIDRDRNPFRKDEPEKR